MYASQRELKAVKRIKLVSMEINNTVRNKYTKVNVYGLPLTTAEFYATAVMVLFVTEIVQP